MVLTFYHCQLQEAELTGIMPPEIPLEPGEAAPTFRRRVGTAYQLPQNLLNSLNNKDELITALEIEKQLQASLAEAALGLANEPNISKVSSSIFCCTLYSGFTDWVSHTY